MDTESDYLAARLIERPPISSDPDATRKPCGTKQLWTVVVQYPNGMQACRIHFAIVRPRRLKYV